MKSTWHFFSGRTAGMGLVGLLALSGCGGKEQRMAKYMEKGKTYLANEDYDKARVEIKNVLQIDPKFAEAYFVAGQIEDQSHIFVVQQGPELALAYVGHHGIGVAGTL